MSDDDREDIKDVFRNPPPAPLDDGPKIGLVNFPDISVRAWEHPSDRAALTALRKVPGFDLVLRKVFGLVSERALRFHFLGSAVRVDQRQFKRVHTEWERCCRILDIAEPPELFVTQTPMVNAGAIGIDKPFVVLNSGAIDLLDDAELRFVLGHELGHVLSGHALYRTMLFIILQILLPRLVFLPAANLLLQGVVMALLEWNRKAELSCDRAGLLCLQSPTAAHAIHMKMAGGNKLDQMELDAFMAQAREYETGGDLRDNIIKFTASMRMTHPYPVIRLAELKRWVDKGTYGRIMDGDYPRRSEDDDAQIRADIKASAEAYKESWAQGEDPLSRLVTDISELVNSGAGNLWDNVRELFERRRKGDAGSDGAGETPDDGPDIGPDDEA